MGRGSNDNLVNKQMPKRALIAMPDVIEVVQAQPCRDEQEFNQCQSIYKCLLLMIKECDEERERLVRSVQIMDAKIKEYAVGDKHPDSWVFEDDYQESDLTGI